MIIMVFSFTLLMNGCSVESDGSVDDSIVDEEETTDVFITDETLRWNEEFNGTSLDTEVWNYDIGNGSNGWGNEEEQYYYEDNVSVGDGMLTITAKEEEMDGCDYTSGKITTADKFYFTYGIIEARIKLPAGTGLWPAFWMMPQDNVYGGWAASGEIDIMEAKGRLTDETSSALHYGGSWPSNTYSYGTNYFSDEETIEDFHIYSCEWRETTITMSVDGVEFFTCSSSKWYSNSSIASDLAPFDQDFYLILNLAVGGTFDSYKTPDSEDMPAEMQVDYIRVYE